jgi:mannose-6-phosphate isomerase-like protein (cupin superfamily)
MRPKTKTVNSIRRDCSDQLLKAMANDDCKLLTIKDALTHVPTADGKRFATIFEHGTLLVEVYAPRVVDPQQPHTRDEIYFVAAGSGEYVCGETRTAFRPTDLLFAAAGVAHRFENFTDDLAVWVLFYGPEGGEAAATAGGDSP